MKIPMVMMHAGAGYHSPSNEKQYKKSMKEICQNTMAKLNNGWTCVEALEYVIQQLENNSLTNAGIPGSNCTLDGYIECDAALMTKHGIASVAAVPMTSIKGPLDYHIHPNPITMVKLLYEYHLQGPDEVGRQPPLMLTGHHVHDFIKQTGIPMISGSDAFELINTKQIKRYQNHLRILSESIDTEDNDEFEDTVGCIVMDQFGEIATGVSSGGISLKRRGRVGEAAIPGAGIWVTTTSSSKAACSLSGTGEQIMKTMMAMNITTSLIHSTNKPLTLGSLLTHQFLNSALLGKDLHRNVGGIALVVEEDTVEGWWFHTTASLCIAFQSGTSNPKFIMSRKTPGSKYSVSGQTFI
ncbi:nucleophile aminohydrolase [Globomyces pollinis-pini]|nr:nucleophile aminohydrolase [Globomyces pollinis-pini]